MLWNIMWILASEWTNKYLIQWLGEAHPPSESIGWIPPPQSMSRFGYGQRCKEMQFSSFYLQPFIWIKYFFSKLFMCFMLASISVMTSEYKNSMVLGPVFCHIRVTTGLGRIYLLFPNNLQGIKHFACDKIALSFTNYFL